MRTVAADAYMKLVQCIMYANIYSCEKKTKISACLVYFELEDSGNCKKEFISKIDTDRQANCSHTHRHAQLTTDSTRIREVKVRIVHHLSSTNDFRPTFAMLFITSIIITVIVIR